MGCEHGTDVLPVQSCAPRTEDACVTSDVMSQEIIYVKKCQNVVSKTCAPVIVKRSADAEPEAEADPQWGYGYGGHYGYAAPVTYALPEIKTKTIETPCAEHTVEHCVDVPEVKKVDCTAAEHALPKVLCEAGKTEVVDLVATYAGR